MKKIISFSLWGKNPFYFQGALENIKLQKDLRGMKPGDQIHVSTYQGSEKMAIDYFQDNHIFCPHCFTYG